EHLLRSADVEVVRRALAEVMPLSKERRDLRAGRTDRLGRGRGAEDVVEPGNPLDLVLRGGPGNHQEVVLVLSRGALALGLQDTEHPEGLVAEADGLSDGVLFSEELLGDATAEHADVGRGGNILRGEAGALVDRPAADREVLGRDPAVDRVPVRVAGDDLDAGVHLRRRALDQRDRLEDRLAVALDERFGRSGPGPNPLQVAAPGLDP